MTTIFSVMDNIMATLMRRYVLDARFEATKRKRLGNCCDDSGTTLKVFRRHVSIKRFMQTPRIRCGGK